MPSAGSLTHLGLAAFALVTLLSAADGRKKDMIECLADLEGPNDDPNNIYHCNKLQTCCHESGVPSCCQEKDVSVAAWEQVALWSTLFGLLFFVAFVMWCCRTDGNRCRTQADGKPRCCCYRTSDKYEEKAPLPEDDPAPDYEDLDIIRP